MGFYKLTRPDLPTKGTKPKIPFHTYFSMCTQQLHGIICGLLICVSTDFKMNSAYQQGVIAPLLKLMRIVDPFLPESPWGQCASSPVSARGEISHLFGTCPRLNGPYCKWRILWSTPLEKGIT